MEVGKGVAKLVGPIEYLPFFQKFPTSMGFFDDLAEVVAGVEIHDQVFPSFMGKIVGDFREIGVIQAGQHFGLSAKLLLDLAHYLGSARVRGDLFDRADSAGQEHVFGTVDRAHAALSDGADDAVALL